MYTAAELILALQRRLQLVSPHKRRPPGEFPPGWQVWFASMRERVGAVTGATAAAIIAVFAQRPLATPPRRLTQLNRWQAFATLWRQQWQPPARDERGTRWFAIAVSALIHLLFVVLLLWLAYVQIIGAPPQGEDVVQVEFIGEGTPEAVGGGPAQPAAAAPAARATTPAAAAATASAAPSFSPPTITTPPLDAPVPEVQQRDVPEPQLPPPPTEQQPVAVSAPAPDTTVFVLPPPTPRVAPPQITLPEATAPTVQIIEVPAPVQPIRRELPQVAMPQITPRVPDVVTREVAAPLERPRLREIATQPAELPTTAQPVRAAEIPSPSAATASSSAAAQAPSSSQSQASNSAPSTSTATAASPSAASGDRPTTAARPSGTAPSTASSTGSGPKPAAAPGSFPTPAKSDDWGASTRNRPGAQRGVPSGIYNADGSPRVGEAPITPGLPPGVVDDRITDLDRSGTWLKRKPTDYEPTKFDRYWRPHETLLQEWVRKGIKKLMIPIPGTNKRIECVVSMLQFGGGCGISDPNLNEQPATARPPPDIPFKPELQEDNGSVKPPPKPKP